MSTRAGPLYSIRILSPVWIVCGVVRVNVLSAYEVESVEASNVSLKLATTVSAEFLTTALTVPDAEPLLLRRTVHVLTDSPIRMDEDLTSSPYRVFAPE
jgi:hypothetical protein